MPSTRSTWAPTTCTNCRSRKPGSGSREERDGAALVRRPAQEGGSGATPCCSLTFWRRANRPAESLIGPVIQSSLVPLSRHLGGPVRGAQRAIVRTIRPAWVAPREVRVSFLRRRQKLYRARFPDTFVRPSAAPVRDTTSPGTSKGTPAYGIDAVMRVARAN